VVPARPAVDITSGQAQLLIISHPDFIAGLTPLVQARQSQGYTVRVVDVEDVYTQFGYAIFSPQAIKDYIRYAAQNMGTEYTAAGATRMIISTMPARAASASSPPSTSPPINTSPFPGRSGLADLDDTGVPDLALGRFPVRTSAELDVIVAKTLAYGEKDYAGTAIFAADNGYKQDRVFITNLGLNIQRSYSMIRGQRRWRRCGTSVLPSALNDESPWPASCSHSGEYVRPMMACSIPMMPHRLMPTVPLW
jgi:hypothetical protein